MKKEIEAIKSVIVDSTKNEFHVDIASDDCDKHFCIYLPRATKTNLLRDGLKKLTLSMRYVILFVNKGYIETFLRKN